MEGKRRYRLLVRFVNLSLRYFSVACYRTVRILRKRRENTSEDELQRSIEELEPPRESKARQLFVSALQIVWHEFRRRRLLTEFHHPILYAVTSPLDYRVSIYSFLLHGNFRFLRFFPKRLRPLWPYSLGERIKERLDAPSITTRLLPLFIYHIGCPKVKSTFELNIKESFSPPFCIIVLNFRRCSVQFPLVMRV